MSIKDLVNSSVDSVSIGSFELDAVCCFVIYCKELNYENWVISLDPCSFWGRGSLESSLVFVTF